MSQRTSPHTLTERGRTTVMGTTLRCRPWQKCTTGQWRFTSMAQVSQCLLNSWCLIGCQWYILGQKRKYVLILFENSHFPEPINTFHGIQENNDEPIRVSYHKNIHYNSVVNPYKASVGVGLGLPSFKPGVIYISDFSLSNENLLKMYSPRGQP